MHKAHQQLSAMVASLPAFMTLIDIEIARMEQGQSLALLVASLQRSDRVQALLNPQYAQIAQTRFCECMHTCLRDKDRFVFATESECWFLLPQLSSETLAILAVHRLLNALGTPLKIDAQPIFFTPNIGIACAPLHAKHAHELLQIADQAQKNAQWSNLRFEMAQGQHNLSYSADDLPKVIKEVLDVNSLEVRYQPKIDLHTNSVKSVEALVRWPRQHRQALATNLLIDVAEQFGLIEQLTMQVVNKVLCEAATWHHQGLQFVVWINLSARLLGLEHLPRLLSRALAVWNLPASSVGLEITESAFIRDIDRTTALLFELKHLGFRLSIDDFGTGYSSLAYLRRFPIDELKIDRVFVQGMTVSKQDRQIVQSIIGLAHNFGLSVVAEGVEEEPTLNALKLMGCDEIQGYYFAHAMPGADLLPWCERFHRKTA